VGVGKFVMQLLEVIENAQGPALYAFAILGQGNAAAGAVQEASAEGAFENLDAFADVSGGDNPSSSAAAAKPLLRMTVRSTRRSSGKGMTRSCSGVHPEIVEWSGQGAKRGALVHEMCSSRFLVFFRASSSERRPDQARSHIGWCTPINCGSELARDGARSDPRDFNPAETSPWPAAQSAPESDPPCA
jgi:hypothetical protein